MYFIRQNSPDDFVSLSLTNGASFGLTSVQLADAASPSMTPVAILFQGIKGGGVMVTNIFNTPGNGADHLLSYSFGSDFASGLLRVNILALRWAMDNLVFGNVVVPEPSGAALLVGGLILFAWRGRDRRCPP
jgi:hypothetical protein